MTVSGWTIGVLAAVATLAGVTATSAASAVSRISVTFVDPERFTDVKEKAQASTRGVGALLDDLARFERARFMREIHAPRIDFELRLTSGQGRVVGEGRRSLRDPNYLVRSSRLTGERLRDEKDLLREWFRGEFAR